MINPPFCPARKRTPGIFLLSLKMNQLVREALRDVLRSSGSGDVLDGESRDGQDPTNKKQKILDDDSQGTDEPGFDPATIIVVVDSI